MIRTLEASADDGDGEGGKAARSKHELVAAEVSEFHDTRVLVESGKGAGVLRCGRCVLLSRVLLTRLLLKWRWVVMAGRQALLPGL